MKIKRDSKGFTLVEAITTVTILLMAVTMALSGYMFMLKKSNIADKQNALDIDVQTAIERLKVDLRLSSMDEIFGYPEGNPPFTAISFPVAKINSTTGRLERNPVTREILWDKTYVYHIVSGTPDELTRTIFDFDRNLDDNQRQAQLNYIVNNDGASGGPNIRNATSQIIFANLLNWGLNPRGGLFSCYSPTPGLETISLGYSLLEASENTLTFIAVDKQGSGYKLGIDQILATPSYRFKEAELGLANNVSSTGPNSPVSESKSSYGNRHQLLFDAGAPDNTLSITIDNDYWEVTDFGNLEGSGYSGKSNTVVTTDYGLDDIVVRLEGNDVTWTSESQTADYSSFETTSNLTGAIVKIMQKGSSVANGNHLSYNGQRSDLTFTASTNSPLEISNIWFGESLSSSNEVMSYSSKQQVYFNGNTSVTIPAGEFRTSQWIDVPIDKDKNYITTYTIDSASSLKVWADLRASQPVGSETTATTLITPDPTNGVSPFKIYAIPALTSVQVTYADEGTFTSDIMDTRLNDPVYKDISWDSILPGNSSLGFKIRFGNTPDLSDALEFNDLATTFTAASASSSHGLSGRGRYVQFQAILKSTTPDHLQTPTLKEVIIDWQGEERMVNIIGKFTKGPDYGDFQLSLNGEPLQAALVVNLEIYEDIKQGINKVSQRISSSIKAEITPRNSAPTH